MWSYDVVEWGRPLHAIERETPQPKGSDVLVRLKYCGVCHSDVHIRDGYFDLGGGKRLHMNERGRTPHVTGGTEPYGTSVSSSASAADESAGCSGGGIAAPCCNPQSSRRFPRTFILRGASSRVKGLPRNVPLSTEKNFRGSSFPKTRP